MCVRISSLQTSCLCERLAWQSQKTYLLTLSFRVLNNETVTFCIHSTRRDRESDETAKSSHSRVRGFAEKIYLGSFFIITDSSGVLIFAKMLSKSLGVGALKLYLVPNNSNFISLAWSICLLAPRYLS